MTSALAVLQAVPLFVCIRFVASGVETLLPPLRQYSELPAWLEGELPRLRSAPQVLMYCTGEVSPISNSPPHFVPISPKSHKAQIFPHHTKPISPRSHQPNAPPPHTHSLTRRRTMRGCVRLPHGEGGPKYTPARGGDCSLHGGISGGGLLPGEEPRV